MERTEGAGGGVTVVAGGEGVGPVFSVSAPFFPPGTITIGLLVGVALGGTHSERPSVVNALGCSPPIELVSDGKSLRSDCSSLLNELSSSPCRGLCQLLGG